VGLCGFWLGLAGPGASAAAITLTPANPTVSTGQTQQFTASGAITPTAVSAGGEYTCVTLPDGTGQCTGRNQFGQHGNGTVTDSSVLDPVSGLTTASHVSAGDEFACALLGGGTARCWGLGESGQRGDRSFSTFALAPIDVTGLSGATALATGYGHACALLGDGTMRCWGEDREGQLGNGTTTNNATPQKVAGLSGVALLAAGGGHTCAATATKMFCWGRDDFGQVGNGGTLGEQHLEPTEVIGVSAPLAIAAGDAHTCAATSSQVLCWGQNAAGQLGTGAAGPASSTPGPVSQPLSAIFLGLGANYSCAVASGDLFCWGENSSMQLGVSASGNQPSPQDVMSNVAEVVAGLAHTCALRTSHALRCWGLNDSGQRGSGGGDEEHGNVFSSGVVAVAAGANHTCAVAAGNLSCWGSNDRGQLGADPATTPSTATPTNVSGR